MVFYVVHKGRKPGIYTNWQDCKKQIDGFAGPIYKKFERREDADKFLTEGFCVTFKGNKRKDMVDKKNEQILDNLLLDQENRIFVYSDGSCIRFPNSITKAGYGIYIPSLQLKISRPLLNQKQTNNRAELTAIIETFQYISKEDLKKEIIIITDSQYSIYIFDKTGERYESNRYIKDGQEVLNKDLIIKALKIKRKYKVKLIKVRAHTNKKDKHSKNNEIADQLARDGAKQHNNIKSDYFNQVDILDLIEYENRENPSDISPEITMNELFEYDACDKNIFEKSKNKKGLKQWFIKK